MKSLKHFLMEGRTGEERHEGGEEGFVEAARFGCGAAENCVDGREEACSGEAEEEGGVSGVVVGEAWLSSDGVEEVERVLRKGVFEDEDYCFRVGKEARMGKFCWGGRRRRGWGTGFGVEVLKRGDPWEGLG